MSETTELQGGETAEAHFERGKACCKNGNCDAAIEDLTKAMELRGEEYSLYYVWRGWAYLKNGNYNAAFEDFEKAIDLQVIRFDYFRCFRKNRKEDYNSAEYALHQALYYALKGVPEWKNDYEELKELLSKASNSENAKRK